MDLTDANALALRPDPVEMPVSELLTGNYVFSIPSYQRGYRWESSEDDHDDRDAKQVDDLLNDLTAFVYANLNKSANYYLQPLMVKPRLTASGSYEWDVLDGQQRLTTMLLILKCLNEKLDLTKPLYELKYENRKQLDFGKITFDPQSDDFNYPSPSDDLDSYYVRKAKDRIARWYESELQNDLTLQDAFKQMLFYPEPSPSNPNRPPLRAVFIWYNADPDSAIAPSLSGNRLKDIEVFNRLNRGKISLTDSELIKALFLLCVKQLNTFSSSLLTSETIVRKWDEMGKKFQNDDFWDMIAPKDREYDNRLDLLFDFIKDCDADNRTVSAYRYFYRKMRKLLTNPDLQAVETLWNDVKKYFDTLCKWHENATFHNYVGYLVDCKINLSEIYFKRGIDGLKTMIKNTIGLDDVDDIGQLSYEDKSDFKKIRKILLLFNVLTCDSYGQKFPFNLYRDSSYDVEHVNSQTDNPIERIEEKQDWIKEHAIPCLWMDRNDTDSAGNSTASAMEARDLIIEGIKLLKVFRDNGKDTGNQFKPYRVKVENYYATGDSSTEMADRHSIGNLTLLNSSINREYKNALFPKKLRVLKRSDQEGAYIPLCTKYMFLKYYSDPSSNASAFDMMRWRQSDQEEYAQAIKNTIKKIL